MGPLPPPPALGWGGHVAATMRLAAPLVGALLAQMAMGVTDTVLLGTLGPAALAAGGMGALLFITAQVTLQGLLSAVTVLVSQARGAGRDDGVPALYWTGLLLTAALAVPAVLLFSGTEALLLLAGEPAALARDTGGYMAVLRWATPGALLEMGLLRAVLPAIGAGRAILWTTLGATVVNGILCYGLIHGAFGLPALGLNGAALATVLVWTGLGFGLLAWMHLHPACRRFATWSMPRAALLGRMLLLGTPIAATAAAETGLFLVVGLLIGRLGPGPLAAQQVALNVVSLAFMAPLGLAQAANVRVGHAFGAGDRLGARRAGLAAIGLGAAFEGLAALLNLLAPRTVAGWYVDPADAEPFAIAVGLLGVAGVFQVADGVQCVAGGALRGLGDTRWPFAVAALGYWAVGFPAAWLLTGRIGAAGAWWGLAGALAVVALLLTWRFLARTAGLNGMI